MILLDKITNKSVRLLPFPPHDGKLPDFSYKLPYFIFSDVFSIFIFPPKIPEQCFIKVFYDYDLKIHFIDAIPFILSFLLLIVTSSHPVTVSFFSPSTMASFHHQRC